MAPGVLHRVIHGTPTPTPSQSALVSIRPALLRSFRRHRVRHADYPAILPCSDPHSSVRGSIVTGLTAADLYRLDIFEGSQYTRQVVTVNVLKDVELDELAREDAEVVEEVQAQTYVWQEGEATLEKSEWDFEEFKRDKMLAWMGMEDDELVQTDDGFADVDRAVAEQERAAEKRRKEAGYEEKGNGKGQDPMGGRGANGHITRQLKEAAV